MSTLLILNDPPYGAERNYNALRLAKALAGKGAEVMRKVENSGKDTDR